MTRAFFTNGSTWLEDNWRVAQRIAAAFAPHAQSPASMAVVIDPGALFRNSVLIETGVQTTPIFTRPMSVRVDRIVIARDTGLISVVAGTEGSLTPPGIPDSHVPCARVFLTASMPVIANDAIFDERVLGDTNPTATPPVMCRASLTTDQVGIPLATLQKVLFTEAPINIGGAFDTSTSQFKPSIAGCYTVFLQTTYQLSAANLQLNAAIYKNGTVTARAEFGPGANSLQSVSVSDLVYLNGDTDYLEFYTAHSVNPSTSLFGSGNFTFMHAAKVS